MLPFLVILTSTLQTFPILPGNTWVIPHRALIVLCLVTPYENSSQLPVTEIVSSALFVFPELWSYFRMLILEHFAHEYKELVLYLRLLV